MHDRLWDWSAVLAAQLINLHFGSDPGICKAILYRQVQSLVFDAMRLAEMEAREAMLRDSRN